MAKFQFPNLTTRDEYTAFWKTGESAEPLARAICTNHGIHGKIFSYVRESSNIIFEIDRTYFLKLYAPMFDHEFLRERMVLPLIYKKLEVQTPLLIAEGRTQGWGYVLLDKVKGTRLRDVWSDITLADLVGINETLGREISDVHKLTPPDSPDLFLDWKPFLENQARGCAEHQQKWGLGEPWLSQIDSYLKANLSLVTAPSRKSLVCADYHDGNLFVQHRKGKWRLTGIVDFADSMIGDAEYDFIAPGIYVARSRPELLKAFFTGYGLTGMDPELKKRCFVLTLLHRFSALNYYINKFVDLPKGARTLDDLANALWPLN